MRITSISRGRSSVEARTLALLLVAFLTAWAVPLGDVDARPKGRRGADSIVDDPEEDRRTLEAEKHFKFGYQLYQQGMLQRAVKELESALTIAPHFREAAYVLALVNVEIGSHREAIRICQDVLERNAYFTECHNVIGLSAAKMGDSQTALRAFEAVKADASFPTPEVAHLNIGIVFSDAGQCGEAVLHFRRALEINRQFGKAWYRLGDCQIELGQLPEAVSSLEEAARLLPADPLVMFRLGYACYLSRQYGCAKQHFDQVRVLAPASREAEAARELIRQMQFR